MVRWYVVALGRRPDADVQVVELPQHERKALIERHKRVKVRPSLSDLYATHLYMCLPPAYTSARLVVAESLSKSTTAVLRCGVLCSVKMLRCEQMVQTMFDKYARRDKRSPAGAMGRKELSQLSKDSGNARIDSVRVSVRRAAVVLLIFVDLGLARPSSCAFAVASRQAYFRDTCEALRADPEVGLFSEHLAQLYLDGGAWSVSLLSDYQKIVGTKRVKAIAPPVAARPDDLNAFVAENQSNLDDV